MPETPSARAWRARNKEKVYAKVKTWKQQNKEKVAAAKKRHKAKHPDVWRRALRKYRLKQELKFTEIAGRPRPAHCDICNQRGKTVFDHDHKTGQFRGWICHRCNLMLGQVKDDPLVLRRLARYLEKDERREDSGTQLAMGY